MNKNKKTNKKILMIISSLIILISVITGVTHSKYISNVTGDGKMEIAKWSFKVNNQTEKIATINLADTYNQNTLINGKMAPGTSGSFNLTIDATGSEVGVEYSVDFKNDQNKPNNLKFRYNNGEWKNDLESLETSLTGIINADDENKIKILKIEWEWLYETGSDQTEIDANDLLDTNIGKNALNYTFDVVVTGKQVRPSKTV